jgi:hypothetical protein
MPKLMRGLKDSERAAIVLSSEHGPFLHDRWRWRGPLSPGQQRALMSLDYDIEIEVSGREHQGKTNLVAYLARTLTDAGVDLIVQRADPQLDEKFSLTIDDLKAKLAGKKIFLREVQTIF